MVCFLKPIVWQLTVCLTLFSVYGMALRKSVLPDSSVLIVYDSRITETIDDYSKFVDSLTLKEYQISYHDLNSKDSHLSLYVNSQRLYQDLIILPSKAKSLGGDVTASQLLDFMNDGGNIFALTSPSGLQDDLKIYLNQLGIFPSPAGYKIVDHYSFDDKLSKKTHDVLNFNSSNIQNDLIISSGMNKISYSGSSAMLSNSQLLIPILQAPRTSYTVKTETGDVEQIYSSGLQSYLSVGIQSRNNARAVWIGSDAFFSDKLFDQNKLFIEDLIDWTFCAKDIIKTTDVEHYHAFDKSNEELYKIKDDVVYRIAITEWNGTQWIPFKADDVQVEVRMLDPYYRLDLVQEKTNEISQYYTTGAFKLPDQHGMFTFYTNYKRSGLSFIEEKDVVTVRHLANDEYQRSWEIPNSWVYVASNVAVFVSFLVFVFIFVYKS